MSPSTATGASACIRWKTLPS
ncbi:hypothetical protein [Roseateles sp. BYS96W]|uniref:Uncharacterized protein n=1 Tax=Pelomonas nitida TaxID=3299027 RepID=A0ABW7G0X9_9BURK